MNFTIFNFYWAVCSQIKRQKINLLFFLILSTSNLFLLYIGLDNHGLTLEKPYRIQWDSEDYINSSEKLLSGQGYNFNHIRDDKYYISNFNSKYTYDNQLFYTFRTPGFSFFYLPLRLFFDKGNSILMFILFQTLLNALAKLCVLVSIYRFTKNKFLVFIALVSLSLIPYFSQYNNLILTDSLGLSFILFGFYYLYKAIDKDFNKKLIFFSGICFTVAIFLRPFLALTLIFATVLLLYLALKKYSLKKSILVLLYFSSSFIIIDSIWVVRNYYHTNSFIPLASTMHYQYHMHSSFKEIKKLSGNLGYSIHSWDNTSPVFWFSNFHDQRNLSELIHNTVLTKNQMSAILSARVIAQKSLDKNLSLTNRKWLELKSQNILKRINLDLVKNHFVESQIMARIKILTTFLTQPIPRDYRDITPEYRGKIIFLNHLVVNFTICGGFIFLCGIWFLKGHLIFKFLSACVLSIVFFFTLIHKSIEYRELYTMTGFLTISAFVLLHQIAIRPILVKLLVILILILVIYGSYYQTIPEL